MKHVKLYEDFVNESNSYSLKSLIGKEFDGLDVGSLQPRTAKVISVNGPKGKEIKIKWTDVPNDKYDEFSIKDFEYISSINIK